MRILVFGATGRTGRLVIDQALSHGSDVVAFVRDPRRLTVDHERLSVVVGDVTEAASVRAAMDGCDAVVFAVGAHGWGPVSVYSDGIANVIRAMTARGIRRLVAVSAVGVGADRANLSRVVKMVRLIPFLAPIYEDMERMEGDIFLSDVDWTIVRPGGLTNGPLTGRYRVVEGNAVPKGSWISRADLAALLLKCAQGSFYLRKAVAVSY